MSTNGLAEFLCDALRPLGTVQARRMFSGAGLFCDGLMFGLLFQDALYLKADADTQGAFEAEGLSAFVYEAKGRKVSLGYWRAPERLLDDTDDLVAWARTALAVAQRKARAKGKNTRAPKPVAARSAAGRRASGALRKARTPR